VIDGGGPRCLNATIRKWNEMYIEDHNIPGCLVTFVLRAAGSMAEAGTNSGSVGEGISIGGLKVICERFSRDDSIIVWFACRSRGGGGSAGGKSGRQRMVSSPDPIANT
jgi:hypothetical protein